MSVTAQAMRCPRCAAVLPADVILVGRRTCPSCAVTLIAEIFPAFFRQTDAGEHPKHVTLDDEAACFHHPDKKAVRVCESCGRFVCALCDIALMNRHICPSCVQTVKRNDADSGGRLQRSRLLLDEIALSLAVLPLLAWPFTIVTAPAAFILAVRQWKRPVSIIPRSRGRLVVAMLFSLLQMIGWTVAIVMLIR